MTTPVPKKILIVVLDNLGDAIMGSSLLPVLRSFFPDSKLGLWVKRYTAGAFYDHPLVDTLHASDPFWDKSPGHTKGGFGPFISVIKDIRKIKYDAALILNTEWRRSLACALIGIPTRVGFRRRKSHYFLTEPFRSLGPDLHVVDEHRSLLEFWLKTSISPLLCQPKLSVSPDLHRWGQEWRKTAGLIGKPLVFIHPFSGDRAKNWPLPFYFDFIETLRTQQPQLGFVMSGTPPEEKAIRDMLARRPHLKIALLIGHPLDQVMAVLSQSRLYVGGDTGPTHLAAALGIPSLCLFGPTSSNRYRPRGSGLVRILQKNPLSELRSSDLTHAAFELLEKKS